MSKLNLQAAAQRLKEADEMRAVNVATIKKPDMTPGVVSVKKPATSLRLTKVTNGGKPSMPTPKEDSKGGLQIPTAEFGGKIVDSTPKMTFKNTKRGSTGGVKVPSVKTVTGKTQMRPGMREIGNPIKRTEDGGGFGQGTEFIKGGKSANDIEAGFPPNGIKSGGNGTPTVGKVKAALIGPESPDSGKVTVKDPVDSKSIKQIKFTGGKQEDPSDGGDRPSSFEHAPKTDNVRESVRSGVTVLLGNKVKAKFGLASKEMLGRMVESYRQHGYPLKIVSSGDAAWKRDKDLLQTIWESLSAEYNFVPEASKALRRKALNRLSRISQTDFNDLYESRQEFVDTLVSGYEQIEKAVRRKFLESLELRLCNVRFVVNGKTVDAEITTEAHDTGMALRQIRNVLQETYGLNTKIIHVFVDAEKFIGSTIPAWKSRV